MYRFEYLSVHKNLTEKELNRIGENGWELVVYENSYYIFKRKRI